MGTLPDDALSIRKVAVLAQQETPGLGTKIADSRSSWTLWEKIHLARPAGDEELINDFMDQFSADKRNKKGRPPLTAAELDTVDAITAATITSNAVKNGVRDAVERIRAARAAAKPSSGGS